MTTTYTLKQNAIRAAKSAAKKAGSDWRLTGKEGAFGFELLPFEGEDSDTPPNGATMSDEETAALVDAAIDPIQIAASEAFDRSAEAERAAAAQQDDERDPAEQYERGADEVLGGADDTLEAAADRFLANLPQPSLGDERANHILQALTGPVGDTPASPGKVWIEVGNDELRRALDEAYALGRFDAAADKGRARKAPKPATEPKAPRERTAPATKVPAPTTEKPIITSPTNQVVARLVDRIEANRGNLEALQAMTFKAGNTYYAKAAAYRDGLIAEARAQQA